MFTKKPPETLKDPTTRHCYTESKTDVDQPEWVWKRITVKYKRFPVEPVCFCILLSFYQSLIRLITRNPPTTHWLALKQTYTLVASVHEPHFSKDALVHPTQTTPSPRPLYSVFFFQQRTTNNGSTPNWNEGNNVVRSTERRWLFSQTRKKPLQDCFSTNY